MVSVSMLNRQKMSKIHLNGGLQISGNLHYSSSILNVPHGPNTLYTQQLGMWKLNVKYTFYNPFKQK